MVRFIKPESILNPKNIPHTIGMIAHLADTLGFQYFLWKEIVYQKENNIWTRTPFTKINVHY